MTTASTGSETGRVSPGPGYVSKTDMVAALIREQIITGELPAGEQLRQRDVAQRFQVSQTPVREAMRRWSRWAPRWPPARSARPAWPG
jgi:DNA-binding GntR family transcriptional regulator